MTKNKIALIYASMTTIIATAGFVGLQLLMKNDIKLSGYVFYAVIMFVGMFLFGRRKAEKMLKRD